MWLDTQLRASKRIKVISISGQTHGGIGTYKGQWELSLWKINFQGILVVEAGFHYLHQINDNWLFQRTTLSVFVCVQMFISLYVRNMWYSWQLPWLNIWNEKQRKITYFSSVSPTHFFVAEATIASNQKLPTYNHECSFHHFGPMDTSQ